MLREKTRLDIGQATIKPDHALTAGSRSSFKLTYFVGKEGLKTGGSIRITVPHGFTTPQVDEFYKDGFVTAESSRKGASLACHVVSKIFCAYRPKLGHSGAWGKSLFVHLAEGDLFEGDYIEVIYGNVSYYGEEDWGPKPPGIPELSSTHEFTVAVDPDGSRSAPVTGYYILPRSPAVTVLPGEPRSIIAVVPSNVDRGQKIPLHITVVDQYLNPVEMRDGDFSVRAPAPEGGKDLAQGTAKRYTSRLGRITLPPESPETNYSVYFVQRVDRKRVCGLSNPVKFGKYWGEKNLYWGDIHAHSNFSDGLGNPEEVLLYACEAAKLDFAALTDHDDIGPYISNEEWEETKRITARFNDPGQFVTFLGFEYRSTLADMNVYYPGEDGPLLSGKKERWDSPVKIAPLVAQNGGMIIPHMHFGADWRGYHAEIYRVMEIYSQHGSAEYIGCPRQIPYLNKQVQKGSEGNVNATFQEILAMGLKLGVSAGSDSHSGRPGLSNWSRVTRTYNGGLTAIFAEEKTRESIWKALYERHCYATTGPRIYLQFTINGYPMGSELKALERNLRIDCVGTGPLSRLEIVKNNQVIHRVEDSSFHCTFCLEDAPSKCEDFYYVRVIQVDGEMAWSSPIWVAK